MILAAITLGLLLSNPTIAAIESVPVYTVESISSVPKSTYLPQAARIILATELEEKIVLHIKKSCSTGDKNEFVDLILENTHPELTTVNSEIVVWYTIKTVKNNVFLGVPTYVQRANPKEFLNRCE